MDEEEEPAEAAPKKPLRELTHIEIVAELKATGEDDLKTAAAQILLMGAVFTGLFLLQNTVAAVGLLGLTGTKVGFTLFKWVQSRAEVVAPRKSDKSDKTQPASTTDYTTTAAQKLATADTYEANLMSDDIETQKGAYRYIISLCKEASLDLDTMKTKSGFGVSSFGRMMGYGVKAVQKTMGFKGEKDFPATALKKCPSTTMKKAKCIELAKAVLDNKQDPQKIAEAVNKIADFENKTHVNPKVMNGSATHTWLVSRELSFNVGVEVLSGEGDAAVTTKRKLREWGDFRNDWAGHTAGAGQQYANVQGGASNDAFGWMVNQFGNLKKQRVACEKNAAAAKKS